MSHQVSWHRACGICKDEACSTIQKLIDGQVVDNVREACRYLSEQLEGEISTEAFRRMYYRHQKKEQPKEPTINERLERACKYLKALLPLLNRTEETVDQRQLAAFIKSLKDAKILAESKEE